MDGLLKKGKGSACSSEQSVRRICAGQVAMRWLKMIATLRHGLPTVPRWRITNQGWTLHDRGPVGRPAHNMRLRCCGTVSRPCHVGESRIRDGPSTIVGRSGDRPTTCAGRPAHNMRRATGPQRGKPILGVRITRYSENPICSNFPDVHMPLSAYDRTNGVHSVYAEPNFYKAVTV